MKERTRKLKKINGALLLALCFLAAPVQAKVSIQGFDLQAHRGGRDLRPENTLAAFRHALELGVTTLETDMQLTKDGVIVLSHNPFLEPFLAKKDGQWVTERNMPLIHRMTLREVKAYDVGEVNPEVKGYWELHGKTQRKVVGERVPTLEELFQLVQKSGNHTVKFNIETKLDPRHPEWGPSPKEFVLAFHKLVKKYHFEDRVMLQSFDWRTLREMKKLDPRITLVALTCDTPDDPYREAGKPGASAWMAGLDIDDFQGDWARAAKAVGADVVSPYLKEVTQESIKEAHKIGVKLVPWTVNRKEDMHRMLDWGVDGIITDNPELLRDVMKQRGMPLPE